jgi:ABC-type antimicrobial peptide transport system permease subunit
MRLFRIMRILRTAIRAIRKNPMRTALTMLGIIIGVAAVIAMMEIGKGSSSSLQKSISSMGSNTIIVFPGNSSAGGISAGMGSSMSLTSQDCDAITKECPAVRYAAPIVRGRGQVVYGNHNWAPMYIYGTTLEYLNMRNWTELSEGCMFTVSDIRSASQVCVLGQTLVRELFSGKSPIGKEVRIQGVSFKVIGVLSTKGANMMGFDQDDILLAPWTTIKFRVSTSAAMSTNAVTTPSSSSATLTITPSTTYPGASESLYPLPTSTQQKNTRFTVRFINIDQILIEASSAGTVDTAVQQITSLLRQRHRTAAADNDDFNIRNMAEMSKLFSSTTVLMTKLLLAVALISLIVGGVGIMNIMLVSVTERTHEIGLRMAVGARGRDILRQFLIEAVVLCVAGGIAGILLGCGSSWLVTYFLRWPTETSMAAIVASVVVSASVGIIFGYYPAWKASRLDPIEALRYE